MSKQHGARRLTWGGAILAVVLGIAPLAAAQDDAIFSKYGDSLRPNIVAQSPDIYFGKTVLVEGGIDDVYGPHVFSLDDAKSQVQEQTSRNEEPDLIVVIPEEIRAQVGAMAFKEGTEVKVVGEIRKATIAEIDDLGDLDDDVDIDVEVKAVLVAKAVKID
jgi:hypothetical protein